MHFKSAQKAQLKIPHKQTEQRTIASQKMELCVAEGLGKDLGHRGTTLNPHYLSVNILLE